MGGPSKTPCRLGELSEVVPRLEIETLLSNLEPYYGKKLVLRGYFILQDVDTTVLLEPNHRKSHIRVNVEKLPAETADELLSCRLKLVDLEGYITHVPARGGEAPIIFGEAMVSPSK